MLKTCRSPNITEYYGSAVVPGTTQLMIVMELMAVSVSELVRGGGSCNAASGAGCQREESSSHAPSSVPALWQLWRLKCVFLLAPGGRRQRRCPAAGALHCVRAA